MSGQIKYFDNGEKNMSFLIEDGSVLKKCNEIWKRIKGVKRGKKKINSAVHTIFWGDEVLKQGIHYNCIAAVNIDSVMKMDKKPYSQEYLEECRYDLKKKKMARFIDAELELDDFYSSDSE